MIDCILNLESLESLIHVVHCVLEDVASEVLEVRMMLRNKCPWAKFVCKGTGRRWATFIARSKFQGFHFKFGYRHAICTDLKTGKQYRLNLDACNCAAFRPAWLP